jgi:hypothetical protein
MALKEPKANYIFRISRVEFPQFAFLEQYVVPKNINMISVNKN